MLINKYGYQSKEIMTLTVARILQRNSNFYDVVFNNQYDTLELSGKFKKEAKSLPVVGDFVYIEKKSNSEVYRIVGMVDRKSTFSRKPAVSGGRKIRNGRIVGGSTEEQVLASNIDVAFIVTDLYKDFNLMRLERYVGAAKAGGIKPVIILNKMDLCENPNPYIEKVRQIDQSLEALPLSVLTGEGMNALKAHLKSGETVVFLGSSGVGKSSIMNLIFNRPVQETKQINMGTGKGKHTTTSGELFLHESGVLLIDTPGIRELTLWCDEEAIDFVYQDIIDIMDSCRFSDCTHGKEPGCAIKAALEKGTLSAQHYKSYLKLSEDASFLKSRMSQKEIYDARVKKRGIR